MCNQNQKWLSRMLQQIRECFNPVPIEPPKVDPEFPEMCGLQRSAESIRYGILTFEYWVSASGKLREWVRNNMLLASLLAVPILIIMPLIGLMLWQLMSWISMLTSLAGSLILFPILVLVALLCVVIIINIIKGLFGLK